MPEHKYFNDPVPVPVPVSVTTEISDSGDHGNDSNDREVAAKMIQAVVRGYFARRLVSMILLDRVIRVWKPEIMKGSYGMNVCWSICMYM